jgi:hypothetical protein
MVKDGLPPFHAPDAPIPVNRTLPECGPAQEGARNSMPFNNAAERALRGIALGRKAWLFCGSDRGGQRAAIMYSLIVTAKMNDVDPQAWLADVLARIADIPQNHLHELLPWNWKPARDLENAA